MKRLGVSFTILIFLYSLIITSLPENTYATTNNEVNKIVEQNDVNKSNSNVQETTEVTKQNTSENTEEKQDKSEPVPQKKTLFTYTAQAGMIVYKSTAGEQLETINNQQELSVVGDVNGFFEVQIEGAIGYIKKPASLSVKVKSGNLLSTAGKVVGKIYESNKYYTVTPTSNNKYQITIGSNHYLIESSSFVNVNTQNEKAPVSSRKEIISINANSKIYADEKLTQPIFSLSTVIKTKILSVSGNTYRIQVGEITGYVPISSTTGKFVAKIKANAKIYKNTSKKTTAVINKNNSIVYTVSKTSNTNLFAISFGSNTYYVNYADLDFTAENPKTTSTTSKSKVKFKSGFVLYQTASTKSSLFTNGLQNEQLVVAGTSGKYYKVIVGNTYAYVPDKYVNGSNQEVTAKNGAVLYQYKNKKYVAIGTVVKGFIFKPTSSNKTYYLFKKGSETFAVKTSATIKTSKGVSLKAKAAAKYPVTLYTERNTAVYNASGVKIGTLNKGQAVHLKAISSKNRAIIDYIGQQAEVAFTDLYHKDIVNGKTTISHAKMSYYLKVFSLMYPEFTKLEVIGKSVEGRNIYALRVGNGKKEILVDAAFHAREYMTTNVILEMIDTYSSSYRGNKKVSGYNVRSTLNNTSIWFLPMMNPDGVMLVQQGISSVKNKANRNFVKKLAVKGSYKSWKANIHGVDLNRNFNSNLWKKMKVEKGYKNYKGPRANSEPETQAFIHFANKHKFKTNLSYHTSGQFIYWTDKILNKNVKRDYNLARNIAKITGYRMEAKPKFNMYNHFSKHPEGYSTSWMIINKKIPALTIEVAPYQGERPVALKYFTSIWNKNKTVPLFAAKEASKR